VSVQRYKTADGVQWRVRWREHDGRMRSRTVSNKREALALDADVKARKYKGEALPKPGRETLSQAYDQWWRLHGSTLAQNTQEAHQAVWNAHVKGRFDHHRLSELSANPQLVDELLADMRERGVGSSSQRRVLAVLSSVLSEAVRWKKIAYNPVRNTPKPPGTRKRHPRPLPPLVIERIRLRLLRRRTLGGSRERNWSDVCFVALMAYAGLRPGEALALTWGDVGKHTLAIDKAVSVGEEGPTKTRAIRTVPLQAELAEDLARLRKEQGGPADDQSLFPGLEGPLWSRTQYRNWRTRVWKPTLKKLAEGNPPQPWLEQVRPYDLRGSFVSLHLRAGMSPLEVASWAGHSPQVMYQHYANVIKELMAEADIPVGEQITRAREAVAQLTKEDLDKVFEAFADTPIPTAVVRAAILRAVSDPDRVRRLLDTQVAASPTPARAAR
jgi:integrase